MLEHRAPTTNKVQGMIEAGGGAIIKSGSEVALGGVNFVTFGTPFASTPRVALTIKGDIPLRDCLCRIVSVDVAGFSFEVDVNCECLWIATNVGNE